MNELTAEDLHRKAARAAYEADRADWKKQKIETPAWEDAPPDVRQFYLHTTAPAVLACIETLSPGLLNRTPEAMER